MYANNLRTNPGRGGLTYSPEFKGQLVANLRANRMKVFVHDQVGVWLAARRLDTGKFAWGDARLSPRVPMNAAQLSALALGLPWKRMGDAGLITIL